MPPSQTAAAADHSDARVAEAFASLVDATDGADERHRLALACSRLTVRAPDRPLWLQRQRRWQWRLRFWLSLA